MEKIANSWWMYLLGAIVALFVLAGSVFFIVRSYKEAKEIGMDKAILRKTIINSVVFTILPSISILIGVIALSGVLGIPLPWIRLSVIGALHYEGLAVKAAYNEELTLNILTQQQFVTIAFVMTLGILSGPIFCLFGFKAYDKKVIAKAKQASNTVSENVPEEVSKVDQEEIEGEIETAKVNEETLAVEPVKEKKPKKNFGDILFDAVFIAMICSFLAPEVAKMKNIGKLGTTVENVAYTPLNTYLPLIVIAVTFFSMFIFDILQKKCKQKWLASFDLGLSMLIGMAVAVIFG